MSMDFEGQRVTGGSKVKQNEEKNWAICNRCNRVAWISPLAFVSHFVTQAAHHDRFWSRGLVNYSATALLVSNP